MSKKIRKKYIKNDNIKTVPKQVKKDWKKEIPVYVFFTLMIMWTLGSILSFICSAKSCNTVSASAESTEIVYTSQNLLNSDYYYAAGTYEVVWQPQEDESCIITGSNANGHTFPITNRNAFEYGIERGQTYTISCNGLSVGRIGIVLGYFRTGASGGTITTMYGSSYTFTVGQDWYALNFYFYLLPNNSFNDTFYPMINKGSVAYPFQPNVDYYEKIGYDDGYIDGRHDMMYKTDVSFLYESKVKCQYDTSSLYNFETDYFTTNINGIKVYSTNLYNAISSSAVNIHAYELMFANPVSMKDFFFCAYGNRDIFYVDTVNPRTFKAEFVDGTIVNCRFSWYEQSGFYAFETQGTMDDLIDKSIVRIYDMYIGSRANLNSLAFSVPNSEYRVGYDNGYVEGYNNGLSNNTGYQEAYQNGLDEGFTTGYFSGKNAGIEQANTYSFSSLMASVFDVPIKAFTGLFDFDILGVNMKGFYLSILTACVVLAVVKFLI